MIVRKLMLAAAVAAASVTAATPANAGQGGVPAGVVDACTAVFVQNAIACQGYYGGNLFSGGVGSPTPSDLQTAIFALLNGTPSTMDTSPTNNTSDYIPPYDLNYSHVLNAISSSSGNINGQPFNYVFSGPALSGLTVFGAHFGNTPDAGNENSISAFWLVDLGANPTHTITVTNGQGVSNAQIFATGGVRAVPEPATWAMMLLGFGGIGMTMRRTRRRNMLMQVA